MNTTFFIVLISAVLTLAVCLSFKYSMNTYQIHKDIRSFRIDSKNRIVTNRLEEYQAAVARYDKAIAQVDQQLSVATSKNDQRRLKRKIGQLTKEASAVENGLELYYNLLSDYWEEINKATVDKNPGIYKQDLENYIRHSGMQYVKKGVEKNGK